MIKREYNVEDLCYTEEHFKYLIDKIGSVFEKKVAIMSLVLRIACGKK
jgi:hypothetical protein